MSGGVLKLDSNKSSTESVTCHLLPCKISSDGICNVSKYFTPHIKEDNGILNCSLRGHPLDGQEVSVPNGYQGVIFKENEKLSSCEGKKELHKIGTFKKFTVWNWDKKPSDNDKLIKALDWIEVASVLHQTVIVEENNDEQKYNGVKKQVKRKHCVSD